MAPNLCLGYFYTSSQHVTFFIEQLDTFNAVKTTSKYDVLSEKVVNYPN